MRSRIMNVPKPFLLLKNEELQAFASCNAFIGQSHGQHQIKT